MSDSAQLHSWKEIAAYLGRGVRTVARWEAREGLPVHRHVHESQASVFAYKAELDAWRRAREVGRGTPRPSVAPAGSGIPACQPTAPVSWWRSKRRWALAAGAVCVAMTGWWWLNGGVVAVVVGDKATNPDQVVRAVDDALKHARERGSAHAVRLSRP